MAGQLRKSDIGSIIRVKVRESGLAFDASAATVKQFKLKKPSGVVMVVPASFESDGKDGIFVYTTIEGDLNEAGPWSGQVYMEFLNGQWHTDTFSFHVGDNLSSTGTPRTVVASAPKIAVVVRPVL